MCGLSRTNPTGRCLQCVLRVESVVSGKASEKKHPQCNHQPSVFGEARRKKRVQSAKRSRPSVLKSASLPRKGVLEVCSTRIRGSISPSGQVWCRPSSTTPLNIKWWSRPTAAAEAAHIVLPGCGLRRSRSCHECTRPRCACVCVRSVSALVAAGCFGV